MRGFQAMLSSSWDSNERRQSETLSSRPSFIFMPPLPRLMKDKGIVSTNYGRGHCTLLLLLLRMGKDKVCVSSREGLFLFLLFSCICFVYLSSQHIIKVTPLVQRKSPQEQVSVNLQFSYSRHRSVLGRSVWETKNTKVHLKKLYYTLGLT